MAGMPTACHATCSSQQRGSFVAYRFWVSSPAGQLFLPCHANPFVTTARSYGAAFVSRFPPAGKLTLDVGAIRERFERDGGFTYIKAGPHKELGATIPTGTGKRAAALIDATLRGQLKLIHRWRLWQ